MSIYIDLDDDEKEAVPQHPKVELPDLDEDEEEEDEAPALRSRMVTLFSGVGTEPVKDIPIEQLVLFIRGGGKKGSLRRQIEEIREVTADPTIAADTKAKRQNQLKKKLLSVTLSGTMRTRDRGTTWEERDHVHSGLIQIDVDDKHLKGKTLKEAAEILQGLPFILLTAYSPRGEGIKAVAVVPIAKGEGEHKAAFAAVESALAEVGLDIDPAPSNSKSVCFVTYDPEIWTNWGAVTIDVPEGSIRDDESEEFIGASEPEEELLGLVPHAPVERVKGALRHIDPDVDYGDWTKVLCGIKHEFLGDDEQGFELFDEWSSEGAKYPGRVDIRKKWSSFKAASSTGNSVTIGTVYSLAKRNGWNPAFEVVEKQQNPEQALVERPLSDAGNAERLCIVHGHNLRALSGSDQWIVWEGNRWKPDTTGRVTQLFIDVMRQTITASFTLDGDRAQKVSKFALNCTNRPKIEAGIRLAKSVPGITIQQGDLDADPMLLGTPNGTIDLKVGRPIQTLREHFTTKRIAVDYDHEATCPRWMEFLSQVTGADQELEAYLKKAVGYTLTGSVEEQCLFFLYGKGNNGKGVFSETLQSLLKDYAQTAPEALFIKDSRGSSPKGDIARLSGCRMTTASELDEGTAFAESRLKALTGGDKIVGRELYKASFEFTPTHKFWISGNHKPTIKGTDEGIWRRIRLIPFTVTFPKSNRDPKLKEKLAKEKAGILKWAVEGCFEWQRDGLTPPACVNRATVEYRQAEDVLGQFLDERTNENPDGRTKTAGLYNSYEQWARGQGILYPLTRPKFVKIIRERGFPIIKVDGRQYWQGLEMVGENGLD